MENVTKNVAGINGDYDDSDIQLVPDSEVVLEPGTPDA
jgi:hypothetical protein